MDFRTWGLLGYQAIGHSTSELSILLSSLLLPTCHEVCSFIGLFDSAVLLYHKAQRLIAKWSWIKNSQTIAKKNKLSLYFSLSVLQLRPEILATGRCYRKTAVISIIDQCTEEDPASKPEETGKQKAISICFIEKDVVELKGWGGEERSRRR